MKDKLQKEMAEYIVRYLLDNGWDLFLGSLGDDIRLDSWYAMPCNGYMSIQYTCTFLDYEGRGEDGDGYIVLDLALFNHNVAKKIFGKDFKYHLQQMVISDNPVKYAYDYLTNTEKGANNGEETS